MIIIKLYYVVTSCRQLIILLLYLKNLYGSLANADAAIIVTMAIVNNKIIPPNGKLLAGKYMVTMVLSSS